MIINKLDIIPEEEFKELIKNSCSSADVLRTLGYSVKGNSWAYNIIADRMNKLGISFGKKFIGKALGVKEKAPIEQILTTNSNYNRSRLRERLLAERIKEYKCECCGLTEWLGEPIPLELHHLNGINNDNRLSNLQLLCPNCHTLTGNYGTKGKGRILKRKTEELPLEDRKKILECVKEYGIVEARKRLPYRNSIINKIVKLYSSILIMKCPDGKELEFNTTYDAAKYLYVHYNIGCNEHSTRSGISRCINNHQQSIRGFTFYYRSVGL